jgi:hypothetical protein
MPVHGSTGPPNLFAGTKQGCKVQIPESLGRCHTFLVGWVFASHVIAAALVQFHDSWRADNLRGTSGDERTCGRAREGFLPLEVRGVGYPLRILGS